MLKIVSPNLHTFKIRIIKGGNNSDNTQETLGI